MLKPLAPDERALFESLLDRLLDQSPLGPNDSIPEDGEPETDDPEAEAADGGEPAPSGADRWLA
jgi:hypothetical protein